MSTTPSYITAASTKLAEALAAESGARGAAVGGYAAVGAIYIGAANAVITSGGEALVALADVTTSRVLAVLAADATGAADAAKATKVGHDDRVRFAASATFNTIGYATLDQCIRAAKVERDAVVLAESGAPGIERARDAINMASSVRSAKDDDDAARTVRNAVAAVAKAKTDDAKAKAKAKLVAAVAARADAKATAATTTKTERETKASQAAVLAEAGIRAVMIGADDAVFIGDITVGAVRGLGAERVAKAIDMLSAYAAVLAADAKLAAESGAESDAAKLAADDAARIASIGAALDALAESGVPAETIARMRTDAGLVAAE